MLSPHNFEQKIGFDKLRALLAEKCLSSLGRDRIAELSFSSDFRTVSRRLDETSEFVGILQSDREFPSSGFYDMRSSLRRIRPEGTFLDAEELHDLRRSLGSIRNVVGFILGGEEPHYRALGELSTDVPQFPKIIAAAERILDKSGQIKDEASTDLSRIRREISDTTASISRSLRGILRSAQEAGLVEKDASPTIRDGRLMIPVAPAFKKKIRGIV
ncbi:MAG: endonuclease MutS2, partial [Tannerellaceae bacterium]|nr:endonuclease MutS2 [Tannerellaceae bacterium]